MGRSRIEEVFHCRRCGTCCQGQGGIFIPFERSENLAGFLRIPTEEFRARYTFPRHGLLSFKVDPEGFCVMYDYQTHGCSIHAVKPVMCRDWPFFSAPLTHSEEFEVVKRSCPGIHRRATWENFVYYHQKIINRPLPASYLYGRGGMNEV